MLALLRGLRNRILQVLALHMPGARTWRPRLHRWRGVKMGRSVFIGNDCLIETSRPHLVSIGDGCGLGNRVTIVAHFRGTTRSDRSSDSSALSVVIEDEAFIGPGVIILPNVTVGRGAVVTAGSVVTHSVPAMTMVRGNPAEPIARCGVTLSGNRSAREFYSKLRPLRKGRPEG